MSEDVQLTESEQRMLNEVFSIFEKYPEVTRKFGVHLLHQHFPIDQNEVLFETHNKVERTLKVVPHKKEDFNVMPLATAWEKNERGEIAVSMFCCDDGSDSGGNDGTVRDQIGAYAY